MFVVLTIWKKVLEYGGIRQGRLDDIKPKKIMSGLSARRKYPSYMKTRTETNLNTRNIVPSKKVTAMP